jgi:hypothetical protein
LHPIQQPFETGADAEAGLVAAIVGVAAKKVIKLDVGFVEAHAVKELGHAELVLVGEKD